MSALQSKAFSILPRYGNSSTLFGNHDTVESIFSGLGSSVLGRLTGLRSVTSCNI